ncbi:hypothetical protein L1887_01754 [Cichorium endivia]|nr:hypothetical protein L1887_01754 [Cichorium endivia]
MRITSSPALHILQPHYSKYHNSTSPSEITITKTTHNTISPSFKTIFIPTVSTGGDSGGGESYNLNFSMTSSSNGALAPSLSKRALQSNLLTSLLYEHHHFQRFQ